jgi:alginate O-acetyltransferase complex protein AlgI
MNFNSFQFLLIFLPAVLVIFYSVPSSCRVLVLVLASLVFYSTSGLLPVSLLIGAAAIGYLSALLYREGRRGWLVAALIYPFGTLFLFKYLDFAARIVGSEIDLYGPMAVFVANALPAGISFYTFQIASFLIDVRQGTVKVRRGATEFFAFVTFFPQLIAGPILRYRQLVPQLRSLHDLKKRDVRFFDGFFFISVGLAYKVFFSDVLFSFHEPIRHAGEKVSLDVLYEILSYSVVIYFDFWGYSLMAIGLALLFGIEVPRNFKEPYKSRTPKEFWRRWHITLSYWIRDYLYVGLGGNDRYKRNILIVFLACGIWHGAGYGFVLWGLLHAAFVIGYHCTRRIWDRFPAPMQVGFTYLLVSLAWPLFYAGARQYLEILTQLTAFNLDWDSSLLQPYQWMYLAGTLVWIFLVSEDKLIFNKKLRARAQTMILTGVLFALSFFFISFRRTFIYFQF